MGQARSKTSSEPARKPLIPAKVIELQGGGKAFLAPVYEDHVVPIIYRRKTVKEREIEQKIEQLEGEIAKLQLKADSASSCFEVRKIWVHISELEDQIEELKKQLCN